MDMIKLNILKWEDYSGRSGPSHVIPVVLRRKKQILEEEKEDVTENEEGAEAMNQGEPVSCRSCKGRRHNPPWNLQMQHISANSLILTQIEFGLPTFRTKSVKLR